MSHSFQSALVAAAVISIASPALAQNLLTNPGFSQSDQLGSWNPATGASWSPDDSHGNAASGSVQIEINDITSIAISQCVPVTAGQVYDFGIDVRMGVQGQAFGKAGIVVRSYSDASCIHELPGFPDNAYVTPSFSTDWTSLHAQLAAKAAATAALVEVRATKTQGSQGATLTANLDEVVLQTTSAEPGCADPQVPYGNVTTSDALYVLRSSVGSIDCDLCLCDTNGSGQTSSSDALVVLKAAVGIEVALECPACG